MVKRAPSGLGDAGRRLWREVVKTYDLEPAELTALEAAARTADEISTLEAALAASAPVVAGSKGQPRPNPLFGELRHHRATLERLLRSIAWPSAVEHGSDRVAAAAAEGNFRQSAALARWQNHREARHGT